MNPKFISSLTLLLAGASMALAQSPSPSSSPSPQVPPSRGAILLPPSVPAAGWPDSGSSKSPTSGAWTANGSQTANSAGSGRTDCTNGGCAGSGHGEEDYQFYGGLEYLLWWIRGANVPALVGVIPTSLANTPNLPPGAIHPIFGGQRVDTDAHSGVRFTAGYWLDPEQRLGVEASYFQLEHRTAGAVFSSPGQPVLGPLFFDPVQNRQVIILSAVPNQSAGTVGVALNDRLWSVDANLRVKTVSIFSDATHLLFGFRHIQFDEGLSSANTTVFSSDGFTLTSFDSFGTHNQFYGGQIGWSSDFRSGSWFLNFTGKFAFGGVHEVANIRGVSQQFAAGQPPSAVAGGVLAQPTNIGHFNRDQGAVVPEITLNMGYQVGQHLRVFVGCDLLYMSEVARPSDQIAGVDSRQVHNLVSFDPAVRATQPALNFRDTDMWVQGLNFGLEFRY